MATSVRLIRRYVWLIDTIRRAGRITLEEINRKWMDENSLRLEHEGEIPERTFHRHRQAIADLFGIDILCNRFDGNSYYIENDDALNSPTFTSWLFNGLAIDNQLMSNREVADRILFEDTPGGAEYLTPIIEALTKNRLVEIGYQRFDPSGQPVKSDLDGCGSSVQNARRAVPLMLKQSRKRWYLIARIEGLERPTVFALDRITSLNVLPDAFASTDDIESIRKMFDEIIGVNLDDDYDCERVVVRVYGLQRAYVDTLPLHPSQTLKKIGKTSDNPANTSNETGKANNETGKASNESGKAYNDATKASNEAGNASNEAGKVYNEYEYFVRPEYEFQRELLRLGPDAEVISPLWLRDEIKYLAEELLHRYR